MKLGYTKIIQNTDFMNANLDIKWCGLNGPKLYWNPNFWVAIWTIQIFPYQKPCR